jgi:hypothetical protein
MNAVELRQKISGQIDRLTPEMLAMVSKFLDSIQLEPVIDSSTLRRMTPIKRGKTGQDLLKLVGTWQGDDLEECLQVVRKARSQSQF